MKGGKVMSKTNSPLRYPGGKAKLYPYVSRLIKQQYQDKPPIYAEAYAGGFGLGIQLLLNNDVESVLINDLDPAIYAFWKCVTSGHLHNDFIDLINDTPIDLMNWKIQKSIYLAGAKNGLLKLGFATFYLNRCNRSGIILANPIGGIEQTGNYSMDCRFNKKALISLVNRIYALRNRIHVSNLDAIAFARLADDEYDNVFFNFDPPYVKAGPTLYKNNYCEADHILLANCVKLLRNKWIMTYDNNTLIKTCYSEETVRTYSLNYSLENKRKDNELIIYDHRIINPPILIIGK